MTVLALAAVTQAHGQRATEQFVPIGQSPGVSGIQTVIGEILQVDARAQSITVADSAARRTVRLSPLTRIWLDRSRLKQANVAGGFGDLRPGRRVEVRYVDAERREVADWVKVEITQP
jgi:hypothetical protein